MVSVERDLAIGDVLLLPALTLNLAFTLFHALAHIIRQILLLLALLLVHPDFAAVAAKGQGANHECNDDHPQVNGHEGSG